MLQGTLIRFLSDACSTLRWLWAVPLMVCSMVFGQIAPVATVVARFPQGPAQPRSGLVQMANGKLYGLSASGGANGHGCIFSVNPSSGAVTIEESFDTDVDWPDTSGRLQLVVEDSDDTGPRSLLSGWFSYGFPTGGDKEWNWKPGDGVISVDSSMLTVSGPRGCGIVYCSARTQAAGFHVCASGGAEGMGTQWKPSSPDVYDFSSYAGRPLGIATDADGEVYGVSADASGFGSVWHWNTADKVAEVVDWVPAAIGTPTGRIAINSLGQLFGIAYQTNASGKRIATVLWRWTSTGGVALVHTFPGAPEMDSIITFDANDNLFGTTMAGGARNNGTLWRRAVSGGMSTVLEFSDALGSHPTGSFAIDGDTIYGANLNLNTPMGAGTIWKWSPATGGVLLAALTTQPLGRSPRGVMMDHNGDLFGTSSRDAHNELLWRFNEGTGIQSLAEFVPSKSTGYDLCDDLVGDGEGVVCGLTKKGGAHGKGALWKWSSSSGLVALAAMGSSSVPGVPTGALARDAAGNCYGLSVATGTGTPPEIITTLWRVTPAGTLTRLATLSEGIHGWDVGDIIENAGTLYGVSKSGGLSGAGAVWRWTPSRGLVVMANGQQGFHFNGNIALLNDSSVSPAVTWLVGTALNGDGVQLWKCSPETPAATFESITSNMSSTNDFAPLISSGGILWGGSFDNVWSFGFGDAVAAINSRGSPLQRLALGLDQSTVYGVADDFIWRYGNPQPANAGAPVVDSGQPSSVLPLVAFVDATVNPKLLETEVVLEFGLSPNALTQRGIVEEATLPPQDADMVVSGRMAALKPSTTYYYRIVAQNARGRVRGNIVKFSTPAPAPPKITTLPASTVAPRSATLDAMVTSSEAGVTVEFEYGLKASYGALSVGVDVSASSAPVAVHQSVGPLLAHRTYHFRAKATSSYGVAYGSNRTFTTTNEPPTATDDEAKVLPSSPVVIPVCANDVDLDGDVLKVASFVTPPSSQGTMTKQGGSLLFTPSASFTGPLTVNYTATDGYGGNASANVTITLGECALSPDQFTSPAANDGVSYLGTGWDVWDDVQVTADAPFAVVESLSWVRVATPDPANPTRVRLIIEPNQTTTSRIGSVQIGGKAHTITQSGVQAFTSDQPSEMSFAAYVGTQVPDMMAVMDRSLGNALPYRATVTGRMPPGVSINAYGHMVGRPTTVGHYVFSVKVTNAEGSTVYPFICEVFAFDPTLKGSWRGLLDHDSNISTARGYVALDIASNGLATGSLILGGSRYSFASSFVSYKDFYGWIAVVPVPRSGLPTLYLNVILQGGDVPTSSVGLDFTPMTGDVITAPGEVVSLDKTSVPAAEFRNRYVAALKPPSNSLDPERWPEGTGFATITVSASGSVSMSGKLTDGTALTASGPWVGDSSCPIYTALYGGTDSMLGWLSFTPYEPSPDQDSPPTLARVSCDAMSWSKSPKTTGRAYRLGWSGAIDLALTGYQWLPPVSGSDPMHVFVDVFGPNAVLHVAGGGIEATSRFSDINDNAFTLSKSGVGSFAPNTAKLSISMSASTGLWTGGFTLVDNGAHGPVTRVVSCQGVVLCPERLAAGSATGFFLLPKLAADEVNPVLSPNPATNTTQRSGLISITPFGGFTGGASLSGGTF